MDLVSLKNNVTAVKSQIATLNRHNSVNGMTLDDFIFNKFISRVDPVEYCHRVLRAHLPESRRYLHSNQVELVRAACHPKMKQV